MTTDTADPKLDAFHLVPTSAHDHRLVELVHPPAHVNPQPLGRYDLVVIGGGTAGLVSAIGAGVLGARVALVERGLMGGDCLNFGCVPSKALLRAANVVHEMRSAGALGVHAGDVRVDFPAVMERVRAARAEIAPHDAVRQVASFGVHVFLGHARFVSSREIGVQGQRLRFRRCILATGARSGLPAIPGLEESGFLTNETVFSLTELPKRLVILGGGPIGCELGQAFARLGSGVTIVQRASQLLPREDADVSSALADRLRAEGVRLVLNASVTSVERGPGDRRLALGDGSVLEADALLVAAGRIANVENLGLEAAGIAFDARGVQVDARLQTTNSRVFAAGDVASTYKFTHAADALARVALQNALFFLRKRATALHVPWCTFTDPEIAHVGIGAREANARSDVTTHELALTDVDRAIIDADGPGLARVHLDRRGRMVGATLVARHAGEGIAPLVLAMTAGLTIAQIGRTIVPYPTRGEVWKRLADQHALARFSPGSRRWVERLLAWLR